MIQDALHLGRAPFRAAFKLVSKKEADSFFRSG